MVYVFILDVLLLGWLGGQSPIQIYTTLSLYVLTPIYFLFFVMSFVLTSLHRRVMFASREDSDAFAKEIADDNPTK
jgi:hypothetical protein